jgi:broad specificity phosphatase PhoE
MSHGITSICHSPLSRAKVTAEIISSIQKALLHEIDDLKERFCGKSEGSEKPEGPNFV